MEINNFNSEIIEKFEEINHRMFNIKHSFELFLYDLQNDGYAENPVELITFCSILKEYFNQTKEIYNKLEKELNINN